LIFILNFKLINCSATLEEGEIKKYSNGEVTIVWKPSVCMHSTMCWKKDIGLPEVFDPRARPWINPQGATSAKIVEQVNKCPSGALSYYYNNEQTNVENVAAETKIEARLNGPLLVYGNVIITDAKGNETRKSKVTAFCRCGNSRNKPFCDGSHVKYNFTG
jgi:uncharacterized Fe-S cluster protein YjdI